MIPNCSPCYYFFLPPIHSLLKVSDFFLRFIYLFLAVLCLCCCLQALSSCGKQGRVLIELQVSHCGDFSCCGAQTQQLWCMGIIALWPVGSSQTRNRTLVPCLGRQIINHWTTGEVQSEWFWGKKSFKYVILLFYSVLLTLSVTA